MSNSNPSIDPANNGSLVGTISFAFSKLMQNVNGMLPAQVLKYDRTTNRVNVQLLITILGTDGTQTPRAQIASLPVLVMGGGGFTLSFPIKEGDFGWVLANDRDISLFLQGYAQSPPNTNRVKNFADGLFIPDAMKTHDINNSNKDYLLIQNEDNSIQIEIGTNPTTGANEINIVADRINLDVGLTGFLTLNGNLDVNGNIIATGAITPATPIIPFPPVYPP